MPGVKEPVEVDYYPEIRLIYHPKLKNEGFAGSNDQARRLLGEKYVGHTYWTDFFVNAPADMTPVIGRTNKIIVRDRGEVDL